MELISGLLDLSGPGFTLATLIGTLAVMVVTTIVLATVALQFRIRNGRKGDLWTKLERKWQPILLEVLAGDRPSRDLVALVAPSEELQFVDYLYRYARRLRGEEAEVLAKMSRPYLAPIVAGVRNGDPERRARAVQTLGVLNFADHAFTIRQALNDPSPLVAMVAARALARPGEARNVGLVLSRLHRFDRWSPRYLSSMLAGMGPDAAPKLRSALADRDADPDRRRIAADALRKLGDVDAASIATDVLQEPIDRDLHCAALRLLGLLGRPQDAPAIRALTTVEDEVVRGQAIRALGQIGGEADVDSLRQAVDDASPWVGLHAIRGLREVGRTDLVETLGASNHVRAPAARQVLAEAI